MTRGAFEIERETDVTPEDERPALPSVPADVWVALGIAPTTIASAAPEAPEVAKRDLSRCHDLSDIEWRTVECVTLQWRLNAIHRRSHREVISNALFLAATGGGWFTLGDRDSHAAFRIRCTSWALCGRWHQLRDAARASAQWSEPRLKLLESLVIWSDRVVARIQRKRAAAQHAALHRPAIG